MKEMPLGMTVFSEQGALVGAGNQHIPIFAAPYRWHDITLRIIDVFTRRVGQ